MSIVEERPLTPTSDPDELARQRANKIERFGKWTMPVVVLVIMLVLWDRIVVLNAIPHYILPGPGLVFETLIKDWAILFEALLVTLQITLMALAVAVIGGVGLAILFTQSRLIEMSFYPYAVILQVTPIVAIAPLIFIYVDSRMAGLLLCAWLVAFFPVLSNTTLGLNSPITICAISSGFTAQPAGRRCAICSSPLPCLISLAGFGLQAGSV